MYSLNIACIGNKILPKNIIKLGSYCGFYKVNDHICLSQLLSRLSNEKPQPHMDQAQRKGQMKVIEYKIETDSNEFKRIMAVTINKCGKIHKGFIACNITKINTPPWVIFTFLKLYKWYQIAQRTTNTRFYLTKVEFYKIPICPHITARSSKIILVTRKRPC